MNRLERVFRFVFGLALLSTLYFALWGPHTPWGYLGLLGLLPLFSGLTGYCVLCRLAGRCRIGAGRSPKGGR